MEEGTPEAKPETSEARPANALPGSYAWRRYFARAVDNSIVMGVITFCLSFAIAFVAYVVDRQAGTAYVEWMQSGGYLHTLLLGVIVLLLWLPIEAFFLSMAGVTPGKWVFGIRVRTQAGDLPSYWTALRRVGLVLIRGMGLGIPIVSLITLVISYDHLVTTGTMSWDDDLKTTVGYDEITNLRMVFCVIAVILWAIFTAVSFMRYFARL
jgi:uncharacterized RDD family membrane protein YckC